MKINFYLPLPARWTIEDVKNTPIDSTSIGASNFFLSYAMVSLYRSLQQKYPDIEIIPIDNKDKAETYCCCTKYNIFIPLLENPDNGKHIAISYCDKNHLIRKDNLWEDLDNCIELFACGGLQYEDVTYEPFHPLIKYTPCTNSTWFWEGYKAIQYYQNKKRSTISPEKPIFIGGGIWNFREYIKKYDTRFNLTPAIPPRDFIKELSKYSIHIDFNGGAEVSNRTFEALGLGAALVRPKLHIQYHNKLIPNYHYAEVPCPDFSDYKSLADAYIETFEKVKQDKDYRIFLSENGRKWWDENCTLESHTKIFTELINLNKLK